jgi:hypothetical protein
VENQKIFKVIELYLRFVSLFCIVCGVSDNNIYLSMFLSILFLHFLKMTQNSKLERSINFRLLPLEVIMTTTAPLPKVNTIIFNCSEITQIELNKLRDFCKSSKCDVWKTISCLKRPQRYYARITHETI